MKKKLYFDNKTDIDIDFIIEIHSGKIRNFRGYNMHDYMLEALLSGRLVENGKIRLINLETKSEFTLEKLTKYDKKKFGIEANYRINSKEISQYTLRGAYIKLNLFQYLKIKIDNKETFFHKMNFLEKSITAFVFPLLVGLIILYMTTCSNKDTKKDTKPTLNNTNQKIKESSPANSHSNKQLKLDLGSLSLK